MGRIAIVIRIYWETLIASTSTQPHPKFSTTPICLSLYPLSPSPSLSYPLLLLLLLLLALFWMDVQEGSHSPSSGSRQARLVGSVDAFFHFLQLSPLVRKRVGGDDHFPHRFEPAAIAHLIVTHFHH